MSSRLEEKWHFNLRGEVGRPGFFAYDTVAQGPALGLIFKP